MISYLSSVAKSATNTLSVSNALSLAESTYVAVKKTSECAKTYFSTAKDRCNILGVGKNFISSLITPPDAQPENSEPPKTMDITGLESFINAENALFTASCLSEVTNVAAKTLEKEVNLLTENKTITNAVSALSTVTQTIENAMTSLEEVYHNPIKQPQITHYAREGIKKVLSGENEKVFSGICKASDFVNQTLDKFNEKQSEQNIDINLNPAFSAIGNVVTNTVTDVLVPATVAIAAAAENRLKTIKNEIDNYHPKDKEFGKFVKNVAGKLEEIQKTLEKTHDVASAVNKAIHPETQSSQRVN